MREAKSGNGTLFLPGSVRETAAPDLDPRAQRGVPASALRCVTYVIYEGDDIYAMLIR